MAPYRHEDPKVAQVIREIIGGIKRNETVVFCGAGISFNSGLPVVNQLVPSVLRKLAMPQAEQNIVMDATIGKMCMPFEAFMEIVGNNSDPTPIYEIYDLGVPNANHILLARLMKAGSLNGVVTTNFDMLFEKALPMKPKEKVEGKDYDLFYMEDQFDQIDWAKRRPRLLKIHGSAHDKKNMGITIKQVANRQMLAQRNTVIKQVFFEGKHKNVLVLVYSCSDAFDLSPQIEAIAGSDKKIFYVDHVEVNRKTDVKRTAGMFPREKKIYSRGTPFLNYHLTRLSYNTDRLVKILWDDLIGYGYDKIEKEMNNKTEWEGKVNIWAEKTSPMQKHNILGRVFFDISKYQESIKYYGFACKAARKIKDKREEGTCLGNIGLAYRNLCYYHEAIEYHNKALKIVRDAEDRRGEWKHRDNLGVAYHDLGDYPKAIEYHKKALKIVRDAEDRRAQGNCLGNLGVAYYDLGDYPKAIEYYEQALEIAQDIGDKLGEGNRLGNLGLAYCSLGEYLSPLHEPHFQTKSTHLDLFERNNTEWTRWNALCKSLYAKANNHLAQALKISRDIGDKQREGIHLGNLGLVYNSLGRYSTAIKYHKKALEISQDTGYKRGEGNHLGSLGIAYSSLGDYPKAIEYYKKARAIFRLVLGKDNSYTKKVENSLRITIGKARQKKVKEKVT
ncbi:MAG: tetratricopeptide repeat protein [Nitrospirota bacterium]